VDLILHCEKIVADRARSGDNRGAGIERQDGAGPASCWSMIFSDLPSPAEASSQTTNRAKGFAQAGNPVPTPDQVRGRLFRDHVLTGAGSRLAFQP
jgi:hypothetical protein